MNDGLTHRVILTLDGNTQRFYVDGRMERESTGRVDPLDMVFDQLGGGSMWFWPGDWCCYYNERFVGTMDRVVITTSSAVASSPEGAAISLTGTSTDAGSADVASGLTYTWTASKNGLPYARGSNPNFTFTPNDNGYYVVQMQVLDKDWGYNWTRQDYIFTNAAPTPAISGAPISSSIGTAITLTGSARDTSSIDNAAGFTYGWSVTKDGNAYANGSGTSFAFTPNQHGSYLVTLNATDKDGTTGSTSTTIAVLNGPPTAMLSGPVAGFNVRGQDRTFTLAATDPSVADLAAGFNFTINWGDGTAANPDIQSVPASAGNGTGVAVHHAFLAAGTYTVTLTATYQGNATSAPVSLVISITVAERQGNPLLIGGTPGDDLFSLTMQPGGGIEAVAPGMGATIFQNVAQVQVLGYTGNATASINGTGGDDSFTLNGATVISGSQTIQLTDVQTWTVNGLGGNDIFAVGASAAPASIDGGMGSDTLDLHALTAAQQVTLSQHDTVDGVRGGAMSTVGGFDNIDRIAGNAGSEVSTSVAGFAGDFDTSLTLEGFASAVLSIQGNLSGRLLAPTVGTVAAPVQSISVAGAVTGTGVIKIGYLSTFTVGGDLAGKLLGYGVTPGVFSIDTITVGGDLTATGSITANTLRQVQVTGNLTGSVSETSPVEDMQSLVVGKGLTGTVTAANIISLLVGGKLAGAVAVQGPLGTASIGSNLDGVLSAASVSSVAVGANLTGQVTVGQDLGYPQVSGATSGSVSAAKVSDSSVKGTDGPDTIVIRDTEVLLNGKTILTGSFATLTIDGLGGDGRDLLIGSLGADVLLGNAEDDILIGGYTAFDAPTAANRAALDAIMAEWNSARSYADRVNNLVGINSAALASRLNGANILTTRDLVAQTGKAATVFDDGALDVLTGSAGQDLFFADNDSTTVGLRDQITDPVTNGSKAEKLFDIDVG